MLPQIFFKFDVWEMPSPVFSAGHFQSIKYVCIGVCTDMHATFPVVEVADRFLGQALHG